MFEWKLDAFFWLVLPIAILEAARIARSELKQQRRTLPVALVFGGIELLIVGVCAATASPLVFLTLIALRHALISVREAQVWYRRLMKTILMGATLLVLMASGVESFNAIAATDLSPLVQRTILALVGMTCVLAIMPVRIADEPKETLVAPLPLILFTRVALPIGAHEPQFAIVVPVVAAGLSLICALWLMSAGKRANQFEPSSLVSEILVCERGVILAFVWMGLSSGDDLAEVGGLVFWCSGALALLALEASLRRRPLPKPMAFFSLAMAVSLPGTIGFVGEDLLANGLLELRPVLAAVFMGVTAINAAALYLALVNIIVDLRDENPPHLPQPAEGRPSFMMLTSAGLAVVIGLAPGPFVDLATQAHTAVVHHPNHHLEAGEAEEAGHGGMAPLDVAPLNGVLPAAASAAPSATH
ncbi:MAG: hypothetical protein U0900_20940 [Myxococcota bacterium]